MDRSKKILLISPFYPPPFVGGSKVYIHNMIENSSFNFDILTSPLKPGTSEVTSARHRIERNPRIWDQTESKNPTAWDLFASYTQALLWLIRKKRKDKPDAAVANAFPFANGFLFLLGRLLGIPVIGVGYAEEFTLPTYGRGFKNLIKRVWIRLTHRHAAGFIVVCGFCRDMLGRYGVPASKVRVVPPCINPDKIGVFETAKVPGHRILSVGRLVERKGFHLLIDAVDLLKSRLPDIHLTIVGEGPYRGALEDKIRTLGLDRWVSLAGNLSDRQMAEQYRQSHVFALAHHMLPNGDTEGAPTVFIEAGASGLPVVGGDAGGARDVIEDGQTGFVVDSLDIPQLAERIERILTNPGLAKKMGEAGIEKARTELSPSNSGRNFSEAILSLVLAEGSAA